MLGACAGGDSPPFTIDGSGCPEIRSEFSQGVVSTLTLDDSRRKFTRGEPISMTFSLRNCGDEPVRRFYPDAQRYDFTVQSSDGEPIWRWSHTRTFDQVLGEETLQTGTVTTYTVVWNQESDDGQEAPPGRYRVLGLHVGCSDESQEGCGFGAGIEFEITP